MPFDKNTTNDFIQHFESKLLDKGILSPPHCPLCSQTQWTVAPGYVLSPIQEQLGGLVIGGPTIPTIPIICDNCGFVASIALGPLGLLPKAQAKTEQEEKK